MKFSIKSSEDVHHLPDRWSSWALHRKCCISTLWNLRLLSKCQQTALWISVPLQGLFLLTAGRKGTLGNELNISCTFQRQISAIPFGPGHQTHSISEWSVQSLFSSIYPVIRDIWSEKSSQTLCFIEIWKHLSWDEANLDNSIPSPHRKCPAQAHISVPGRVWTGLPVSNKLLIPWLSH